MNELPFLDWVIYESKDALIEIRTLEQFRAHLNAFHKFSSINDLDDWEDSFRKDIENEHDEDCLKESYDTNAWDYESYSEA